ncbi:MAG: hypothetical protein ACYTBP_07790 [Planctomycetota bacterium]|jgi:hypothetical protein
MDNFDFDDLPAVPRNNEPLPFDDTEEKSSNPGISHSPLDLGEGSSVNIPKVEMKPASTQKPTEIQPAQVAPAPAGPAGRITGTKIFFAKLHAGAIEFLDGQISDWLKNNPNIMIKMTNVCVGEIQSKKTEQNLIITVWY